MSTEIDELRAKLRANHPKVKSRFKHYIALMPCEMSYKKKDQNKQDLWNLIELYDELNSDYLRLWDDIDPYLATLEQIETDLNSLWRRFFPNSEKIHFQGDL